jgi:diamine N-acetyltransferase
MEPLKSNTMSKPTIRLRAVEFEDADRIMEWENDWQEWQHSGTLIPFSRYQIEQYVLGATSDFWTVRQLRLMIETTKGETVGAIDLFEGDPVNRRAGIGITISRAHRHRGFAFEALNTMAQLAFERLNLHQLWCNVAIDNKSSRGLFEKAGYQVAGQRKDWLLYDGCFHDVVFMQLINPNH